MQRETFNQDHRSTNSNQWVNNSTSVSRSTTSYDQGDGDNIAASHSKAGIKRLIIEESSRIKFVPLITRSRANVFFSQLVIDGKLRNGIVSCSMCSRIISFPSASTASNHLIRHMDTCPAREVTCHKLVGLKDKSGDQVNNGSMKRKVMRVYHDIEDN